MSTLYVVATPIGNLEDVTLRAIRILREVGLIAAEDTRRTKQLLSAHQIKTPLTSYHEHNKRAKLPYLLRALDHGDLALVSEAGMPGINDPGYDLVLAAIDHEIKVVPVPGPSAILAALAVSGFTTEQFIHLGFLPRTKSARKKLLESIADEPRTIVAFETPHRLRSVLEDMGEVLGERRLTVCREMTKLHEEIFRGTVSQAIEHFAKPRGEFTLVIEGKARK
jgi:16S rRNA (cytidine1402-2'-O)-methyltransferase